MTAARMRSSVRPARITAQPLDLARAISARASFHGRTMPQRVHRSTSVSSSAGVASAIDSMRSEHLAGIEDAVRVEQLLDTAHEVERDRVLVLVQYVALHDADAVLGRDRAVVLLHHREHDLVDVAPAGKEGRLVHVFRLIDDVVDVAVADMTEGHGPGAGDDLD